EPAEGPVDIEGGNAPGQGAGIEADEDIGGDAAAAENGPFFLAEGFIGGAGVPGGGVAVEDFDVMEAFHNLFIVIIVSLVIWFLDTPPGGCIITGDGQTESGPVRQLVLFLYQALAKGPSADDRSPVPVLEGAC